MFRSVIEQLHDVFDSHDFIRELIRQFPQYYDQLLNDRNSMRVTNAYIARILSKHATSLSIEKVRDEKGGYKKVRSKNMNERISSNQLWRKFLLVLALMLFVPSCFAQSRLYADVNGDGEVNIADVNAVIDVILGGTTSSPDPDPEDHEYVDLGLPSGTLWATMNIGADSPEGRGLYYAWGEVTSNSEQSSFCTWEEYEWCYGTYRTLSKYCTKEDYGFYGFVDNKTELEPEDDVATVNWGASWCMPTYEQIKELYEVCYINQWTKQNGVWGRLFIGPSGAKMFLPASGYYDKKPKNVGESGYYWSRTLDSAYPSGAYFLQLFGETSVDCGVASRCWGLPVRAVRVSQN